MAKGKVAAKRRTQAHLKAPRDSFMRVHLQQARLAFSALWLRPFDNLLTLAVISMALALPASLYLLTKNMASVAGTITSPAQISVYIQQGTPEPRIMILKDQLELRADVNQVDYISSQQGLAELSQYAGFEQTISFLDEHALPAVLVITPNTDDPLQIKRIAQDVTEQDHVTDVRLDEDWLARLDAIRHVVLMVVISLSLLMLASIFLIIGNTLRFNVQANKDEIQTMKLIGATDSYILRPYQYSGMWFGLLGSLSAWLLTALMTIVLNSAVAQLARLYDSQFRLIGLNWDESLLLLVLGTLLGCVAAHVSARRHLKEIEPL